MTILGLMMIHEIFIAFFLRSFDSGQPAQRQQRWRRAHSWSLWDWLDGPSFIVVRMLCICLKSGQFAITAVLLVATKGHEQCWQRPAASLENHRGRDINYINRYIKLSQCIFVKVSTIHYRGYTLMQHMSGFNLWTWSMLWDHRDFVNQKLRCCVFCKKKNGFTI